MAGSDFFFMTFKKYIYLKGCMRTLEAAGGGGTYLTGRCFLYSE